MRKAVNGEFCRGVLQKKRGRKWVLGALLCACVFWVANVLPPSRWEEGERVLLWREGHRRWQEEVWVVA